MAKPDINFELRSDEVRKILKQEPRRMVRWGTVMIILFFAVTLLITKHIRHTTFINGAISIHTISGTQGLKQCEARMQIKPEEYPMVKQGQKVVVRLHSFSVDGYAELEGLVYKITVIPENETCQVRIKLPEYGKTRSGKILRIDPGMTGTAKIITDNSSLFDKIFCQLKTRI
jgi:hypothetical protein